MAKRRTRRGNAGQKVLRAWEQHTRQLLDHLLNERKQATETLALLDQQIGTIKTVLGQPSPTKRPSRQPSKRPQRRTRGGRRLGGISGAVLQALASRESLTVPEIVKATGLERIQVYASLMGLKKAKKVVSKSRGSYSLAGTRAGGAVSEKSAVKGRRRGNITNAVLNAVRARKNISRAEIVKATGLKLGQVQTSLMSLKKAKKVTTKSRGTYCLA
ncbi:MAG: hypothetical protein JXQ75_10090 [Phycisphaerae bacterium]|nr:hypothetical protein [Phycisphaerae bacterium]